MRALVTGCAGFIGSHLTESLLADGHEVLGVDCFNDNYGRRDKLGNLALAREWDSFTFVPLDLARGDLGELVEGADVVFHLAAEPGVWASWGRRFETYLRNNVLATQHLLEALSAHPGSRLVHASSSSVYGDVGEGAAAEDALPRPESPYGVTKLAAEHLVAAHAQAAGLDAVRLRYFSVYGPRQRPDMAFAAWVQLALAGEPVRVFGDGAQTREFTHVADVVAATRAAAERSAAVGGVFNVGGGTTASVRVALALLEEALGRPIAVRCEPVRAGDVRHTRADLTRAAAVLDHAPQVSLLDGLAGQIAWAAGTAVA